MSSNNNKIIQDEYGITIRDADGSTGNILKLIAGAILISKDNGLSYTAGLTADGFNGALITAGEIDTSKVVIRSSETPSLQLDELGLTAYRVYNSDDEYDSSGRAIKSDGTIGTYLPIVRHD
nr:MAG TPA: minor structural protein [Caudoviricetes sp.]